MLGQTGLSDRPETRPRKKDKELRYRRLSGNTKTRDIRDAGTARSKARQQCPRSDLSPRGRWGRSSHCRMRTSGNKRRRSTLLQSQCGSANVIQCESRDPNARYQSTALQKLVAVERAA